MTKGDLRDILAEALAKREPVNIGQQRIGERRGAKKATSLVIKKIEEFDVKEYSAEYVKNYFLGILRDSYFVYDALKTEGE